MLRSVELGEFADASYLGFIIAKDGNHYTGNMAFSKIISEEYEHYESIIRKIGPSFLETERPYKSFCHYDDGVLIPNQDELHQGGIARFLIDNCMGEHLPKRKGYMFNVHKMSYVIGKCYAANNDKPPEMMFVKNTIIKTIQFHNDWETYRMYDDLETSISNYVEEIRFNLFSDQGAFYNKELKPGDRIVNGAFEHVALPKYLVDCIKEGTLYKDQDYSDYVGKSGVPLCRLELDESTHINITSHDLLMIQSARELSGGQEEVGCGYVEKIRRAGIEPIYDCEGLVSMANAGWIGLPNTAANDLTDFHKRRLLRREVNTWGDCVRLRYVDYCTCRIYQDDFLKARIRYPGVDMTLFIDKDRYCPYCLKPLFSSLNTDERTLWEHMSSYTNFLARNFDGIRIDNAHGTSEHVYSNLLRHARTVNPNLFITPELFIDSDSECRRVSAAIGATCCLDEGIHITNHGAATGNVLAATNAIGSNGKKSDYHKILTTYKDSREWHLRYPMFSPSQLNAYVSRYPSILYDITHDNEVPGVSKYACSAQHMMFMIALNSSVSRPVGTTFGVDILLDRRLTVFDRRVLPSNDEIQSMYIAMRNRKPVDSDSVGDVINGSISVSDVGLIKFRKSLNLIHELSNIYFTSVYSDYHDGALVTTRIDPDTGMGVIIIAKDDFEGKARYSKSFVSKILEENPLGLSNGESLVIKTRGPGADNTSFAYKPPLYPTMNELKNRNYVPLKMSPLVPLRSQFDKHTVTGMESGRERAAKTQAVARFKPKSKIIFKNTGGSSALQSAESKESESESVTPDKTLEQSKVSKEKSLRLPDVEISLTETETGMSSMEQTYDTYTSVSPSANDKISSELSVTDLTDAAESMKPSSRTEDTSVTTTTTNISPFNETYEMRIPFRRTDVSTILFCQSCLEDMTANDDNTTRQPNSPYSMRSHILKFRQNSVYEMYQQFTTVFSSMNEDSVHPLIDEGLVQSISDCVRALDTNSIDFCDEGVDSCTLKIQNFDPGDVAVLFIHPSMAAVQLSNMRKASENMLCCGNNITCDPTIGMSMNYNFVLNTIKNCFDAAPTALSDMLYVTSTEAVYDSLYNPFSFNGIEPTYCGLASLHDMLHSDMWVSVLNSISSGDWLLDYIVSRMEDISKYDARDVYDDGINVHSHWCAVLKNMLNFLTTPLKEYVSHTNAGVRLASLRNLVAAVVNAVEHVIKSSTNSTKRACTDNGFIYSTLSLLTLSFTRICRRQPGISPSILRGIAGCCQERLFTKDRAFNSVYPSMCAGFPHFSVDYMRNWGRDTFISFMGLVSNSEVSGMDIIRTYAMVVRHGLVPNLLASGASPRYNARDAAWHFLNCVAKTVMKCKQEAVDSGRSEREAVEKILNMPIFMLFPSDNQGDYNVESVYDDRLNTNISVYILKPQYRNLYTIKPLKSVIMHMLSCHLKGINFREWNAGHSIDSKMRHSGFDITAGVLYGRDLRGSSPEFRDVPVFITGGSVFNCGTWMDKMGESERSGNYGVPSTPRYGCAVELQGLCHSLLVCLTDRAVGEVFFEGVKSSNSQIVTPELLLSWRRALETEFERFFYVPGDKSKYKMGYIKDTLIVDNDPHTNVNIDLNSEEARYVIGKQIQDPEHLLRPNYCTALAASPSIMRNELAVEVLHTARELLVQNGSIGAETLTSRDEQYVGYYDQGNDGTDSRVARGFSYHNGPEWVHMYGHLLCAEVRSGVYDKSNGFNSRGFYAALTNVSSWLQRERNVNGMFNSVPELTNANGSPCPASCASQAWAVGCLLEAMNEAEHRKDVLARL